MSKQNCCDTDAESLVELFEPTVEVPLGVFLAATCCGCCSARCC